MSEPTPGAPAAGDGPEAGGSAPGGLLRFFFWGDPLQAPLEDPLRDPLRDPSRVPLRRSLKGSFKGSFQGS